MLKLYQKGFFLYIPEINILRLMKIDDSKKIKNF